eukprot:scaffold23476_cov125-Cylindrotheca_fusiformis.AAC.8
MAAINKATFSSNKSRRKLHFRLFLCFLLVPVALSLMHGILLIVHHEAGNTASTGGITKQIAKSNEGLPSSSARGSKNLFHFIISSDCTSYQRWEALTLLHSAEAVSQCGRFTWIVSGCLPDGEEQKGKGKGGAHSDILTPKLILQELEKHFPNSQSPRAIKDNTDTDCSVIAPQVHFTPDYSDMSVYGGPFADGTKKRMFRNRQGKEVVGNTGNTYKFNNKPNGLLHWIKQYESTDETEAIVLIDPDFLFLAPFKLDLIVKPKQPVGAKYMLGGQWLDFNRTQICGEGSECTKATSQEVNKYYSTGAPYIIHIQDVLPFATKWAALVPPTYDYYRKSRVMAIISCMAAADLGLKHTLLHELFTGCMVDWPRNKNDEQKQLVYQSAKRYVDSLAASLTQGTPYQNQQEPCIDPAIAPPPFLHYCRRYSFSIPFPDTPPSRSHTELKAPYRFFAKRRVDHDVLNCGTNPSPFVLPFEQETDDGGKSDGDMSWNAITVCALTQAISNAKRYDCKE